VSAVAPSSVPKPAVTAVGVVVPARDEQERIGACLASVRRALAGLPADVAVAVVVVLDRCVDATPEQVAAVLTDWPEAVALTVAADGTLEDTRQEGSVGLLVPVRDPPVLRCAGAGVGAVRDLGVRHVLEGSGRTRPPAPGC
jgi:hypothetical protein